MDFEGDKENNWLRDFLQEKKTLRDAFSAKAAGVSDTESRASRNAIKARAEKMSQDRENLRKSEREKQSSANSEKTRDLHIRSLLTELSRAVDASFQRLQIVQKQQDAISRHLALLLAGEEIALDDDGSLADKVAEAAVKDYEKAKNEVVDRLDPVQIQAVLEFGNEQLEAEKKHYEKLDQMNIEMGGTSHRTTHNFLEPSSAPGGSPDDSSSPLVGVPRP